MYTLDALVAPVGVLVRRPDEQDVRAGGVRPVALDAGLTTFPRDLDIFAPSRVIMPCVKSFANGSWKSSRPMSASAFTKNRA